MPHGLWITIIGLILFGIGVALLRYYQSSVKDSRTLYDNRKVKTLGSGVYHPFRLLDDADVEIQFTGKGIIKHAILTDHFSSIGMVTNEEDYAKHWAPKKISDNAIKHLRLPRGEYLFYYDQSRLYNGTFTIKVEYMRMKKPEAINYAFALIELGTAIFAGGLVLLVSG